MKSSRLMSALRETAEDLHKKGLISKTQLEKCESEKLKNKRQSNHGQVKGEVQLTQKGDMCKLW